MPEPITRPDAYIVSRLWADCEANPNNADARQALSNAVTRITGDALEWSQVAAVAQSICDQGTNWVYNKMAVLGDAKAGDNAKIPATSTGGGGSQEAAIRAKLADELKAMVARPNEDPPKYTGTVVVKVDKNDVKRFKNSISRLAEGFDAGVRVVDEKWPLSFNATLTLLYYDAPQDLVDLLEDLDGVSSSTAPRAQGDATARNESGAEAWRVPKERVRSFKSELYGLASELGADVEFLSEKWPLGFKAKITFAYSKASPAFVAAIESMRRRF